MAAIQCDLCDSEPAAIMQTNVDNGQVIAVGNSCILTFTLTVAGEIVAAMPADLAANYAVVIRPIIDKLQGIASAGEAVIDQAARAAAAADGPQLDEDPASGDMVPIDANGGQAPAQAPAGGN